MIIQFFLLGDVPNNQRPCELALSKSSPGNIGGFEPECESDGSFKQKQCHDSIGHCWCVDTLTGEELEGTRIGPDEGEVNCGEYFLFVYEYAQT